MANYLSSALQENRRAVKCWRCGNFLHFRHWSNGDQVTLAGGYFCQQWKLCMTCAIRRGADTVAELAPIITEQLQRDPQLRAYLVTVTTKDGADMSEEVCRERFLHLKAGLKHMTRRRGDALKKERGEIEACKAVGIYSAIEGGRGAGSGGWHWHCHMVWLCRDRPDKQQLAAEWYGITGDSFMVNVKTFRSCKASGERTAQSIARDVCEVAKYTLKPHQLTPADAWTTHKATRTDGGAGMHFVSRIGSLRLSPDERAAVKERNSARPTGPFRDIFYRWHQAGGGGHYQEVDGGGIDPGEQGAEAPLMRGYMLDGAADVRREAKQLDRARIVAMAGVRGAQPPGLDTRAIFGDTFDDQGGGQPPDPGPPTRPARGTRFASSPSPSEDLFHA